MKSAHAVLGCVATVAILLLTPALARAAARPATHTHPRLPAPGQTAAPRPLAPGQTAAPRPLGATVNGTETTSVNWCGYDVLIGPYESVTATWVQPKVYSSGGVLSDAAFWVGLDGDGSNTVEQIGTEGYSQGVVAYDAWYEMYPDNPVTLGMSIKPGDTITASVSWTTPATFTLSLQVADCSAANTDQVQITVSCTGSGRSSRW